MELVNWIPYWDPPFILTFTNFFSTTVDYVDAKFLSRDPQVVATYKNDPNVHSMVSLTTASDFFQTADMLLEKGWKSFNVPLLIAHGTADYLTW